MNDLRPAKLDSLIEWHQFAHRERLAESLAELASQKLQTVLTSQSRATIAVSGGSTPMAFFQKLSTKVLAWNQISVALVDERFVPADHSDSNERLVRENLLRNAAEDAEFVGMVYGDNVDDSVVKADARYQQLASSLAMTILGMGNDGHTASLFPGSTDLGSALDPDGGASCSRMTPIEAPHDRITMTAPLILKSHQLVLHIVGEDKLATLNRALELADPTQMPIYAFLKAPAGAPLKVFWSP